MGEPNQDPKLKPNPNPNPNPNRPGGLTLFGADGAQLIANADGSYSHASGVVATEYFDGNKNRVNITGQRQ